MENAAKILQKELKNSSIFADFNDSELKKVVLCAKRLDFKAKSVIFSAEEPAKTFYIVTKGAVKVYQLSKEGREHLLNIFGKDDILALPVALNGAMFPAFAETIEPSSLIAIPAVEFLKIVEQNPKLAVKIIRSLASLVHLFVERLASLTLKDALARLSGYLIDVSAGEKKFILPVRKNTISLQLNIQQETLSRAFAKLKEKEIIEINKKEVFIKDAKALANLV